MNCIRSAIWFDILAIRTQRPIVLNITNFVAMDLTANALLALGASPMMAHAAEEIDELTTLCAALVLNIGTLDPALVANMQLAFQSAAKLKKPCVFDPVGAGATTYRTQVSKQFLEHPTVTCIRGNASEITACFSNSQSRGGIDSDSSSNIVAGTLEKILLHQKRVSVISGEIDYILGFGRSARICNGNSIMTQVTAMGCTATAVLAAFLAVNNDYFAASVHAMTVMGICGEMAHAKSSGPGSFRIQFIDCLASVTEENLNRAKVRFDDNL